MITIIHGDDIVSSRKALSDFKEKGNSVDLDEKTLNLEKIKQEFEGGGLFGDDKIIIIENLLSSEKQEVISYLAKENLTFDLILWEEKELTQGLLKNFFKAQILLFKLKPIIFNFLDNIRPGNHQLTVKLFHEVLKTTEVEIVFYMLIRQFRLMLAIVEKGEIDEIKKLASWQLGKLKKQASLLGREKLISLYQKLFKIEVAQKTGQSPLPLTIALDLFLLEI